MSIERADFDSIWKSDLQQLVNANSLDETQCVLKQNRCTSNFESLADRLVCLFTPLFR